MNTGAQSPLWYTTRGIGMVMLLALSASVVLGLAGSLRWKSETWPAFLVGGLHRNVSLVALGLLPLHAGTILLDSYVRLSWKDVLVPFASAYRPLWLGLGVLAGELMLVIVVTSLLRRWIGFGLWRFIHWSVYAAWPLAMLHGLGTGTDSRAGWALLAYAVSGLAVLAALAYRLAAGSESTRSLRLTAGAVVAAAALAAVIWTVAGPLHPGWAFAAGTPRNLLASTAPAAGAAPTQAASPASAPPLPAGLDVRLRGQVTETPQGGIELDLAANTSPPLQVVVDFASQDATTGPLQLSSGGQLLCSTEATFQQEIDATCGSTAVVIEVRQLDDQSSLFGRLVTQPTS